MTPVHDFPVTKRVFRTLVTVLTFGLATGLHAEHGRPNKSVDSFLIATGPSVNVPPVTRIQAIPILQVQSVTRETAVVSQQRADQQIRIIRVNCIGRGATYKAIQDRGVDGASVGQCADEALLIPEMGNSNVVPKHHCSLSKVQRGRCKATSDAFMSRVIRIPSAYVDLPVGLPVEIYRLPASSKSERARLPAVATGEILSARSTYVFIYTDRLLESTGNYGIRVKASAIFDRHIKDLDW